MRGLALLNHSLRVLFGNLGPALRISLLLYALMQGAFLATAYAATGDPLGDRAIGDPYASADVRPGWGVAYLGTLGLAWVLGSWIAVRWHRFVLMEEYPGGAVPRWDGGLVLGYMWRSLKIGLAILAIALLVSLAWFLVSLSLAGGALIFVAALVPLVIVFGATYVGLRISLGLPGVALGRDLSIADSWGATAPASGAIAVLAVLLALLNAILSAIAALLALSPTLSVLLSLVVGWITLMLSVAVLTTLYGHLIEGRELA